MLSGKKILLGVTGGIAAYKSAALLREFQKAGAEIRVAMTPSAARFVGTETFSALSRNEVAHSVFSDHTDADNWVRHIHWTEWADAIIIAPCTANTLAKMVHGITDTMLTSMVSAARCPVLICPTMDGQMYHSKATQRNLIQAREDGYHLIEPEKGYLASGLHDQGRLPEPAAILHHTERILNRNQVLKGKKVLVTAGPTREYLDPVRFLTNPSSGKMGIALARAAHLSGADVTLLLGPTSVSVPDGISVKSYVSSEDLFNLVKQLWADYDILIMSAAVSDFRPANRSDNKVKKVDGSLSLELERTTDILEWAGSNRRKKQTLIGFAMETENLEDHAKSKLKNKNLDWIAANNIQYGKTGFEVDRNELLLIGKNGDRLSFEGEKTTIARDMITAIFGES